MGAVYQARDMKRQGTVCAIKEMSLSMVPAEEREQAIENFKIEAKILWGLNHPNLPALTGFFSENQRYFLVMEYIDGMTLEELLDRNGGPFSERRVLGWARQLCDVLEYLHSQNPPIIFRDMKPGNIMLTRSGHIKLIDFGIARFFRPSGKQDTQHLGTPGFAPPEQYGTAQTDVRSDIYSLAMTLSLLLTNTLSEHEFGLKNLRALNPKISPVVARALEKAADAKPERRYHSVAEFRSALLGVGFVFDNGELAMDAKELADLCTRFPEEAADYLAAGEIEAWLHETNQEKLAREAQRIRTMIDDPQDAVESFVQIILGQGAQLAPQPPVRRGSHGSQNGRHKVTSPAIPALKLSKVQPTIQVNPRSLDFGLIYTRGISAPITLTISGEQGVSVRGTIYANEGWVMLDQSQFDGASTEINVRINSNKMYNTARYTATIVIAHDNENAQRDILVPVEAEIVGANNQNGKPRPLRKAKTANADLDAYDSDDDDYDSITMGTSSQQQVLQMDQDDLDKTIPVAQDKESEYRAKFGPPQAKGSSGWEPLQMSLLQRLWMQRTMTFIAAFMLSSLVYTLATSAPMSPLPPSPWFILILAGIIPAATLGALMINWNSSWPLKETLNRACTGMGASLPALALIKIIFLLARLPIPPAVSLLIMLLVAAISATAGITRQVSDSMLDGLIWLLQSLNRRYAAIGVSVLGGILGYILTIGLAALSPLTLLAILVGAGVGLALADRVNKLIGANQP